MSADIILVPTVGATTVTPNALAARNAQQGGRNIAAQNLRQRLPRRSQHRGVLHRIRNARAHLNTATRGSRLLVRGSVRAAGKAGLGMARLGVVGFGVTLAAFSAVAAHRMITGRNMEQLGLEVQEWLFGDNATKAMASQRTLQEMTANPYLTALAAAYGEDNQALRAYQDVAFQNNFKEADGRLSLAKEFPVNNLIEDLAIRLMQWMREWWTGGRGRTHVEEVRDAAHKAKRKKDEELQEFRRSSNY